MYYYCALVSRKGTNYTYKNVYYTTLRFMVWLPLVCIALNGKV